MLKHYNLTDEKMPCSIVVGEDKYIFADYYTTVQHERRLKQFNEEWIMIEVREETVIADTEGGCDRTEEVTFVHSLNIANTIFKNGEIVGFYYEYEFYNGYSTKPNAHAFLLDDETSWVHYNQKSTWKLQRK